MLKRILLIALILSLISPVFAQEDLAALPLCTPEQRAQIAELLRSFSSSLIPVAIIDGDPAAVAMYYLPGYAGKIHNYQTQVAVNFPACAEGIAMRDYWQVRFERELALRVLGSLEAKVVTHGLPAYAEPIETQLNVSQEAMANLPDLDAYLTEVEQGTLFPNGFPACGDRAASERAKYDDLLARYEALYPAFVEFMDSISGDFDTLFESEKLAFDAFMLPTELCAENFEDEVVIVRMMTHTSLAIHLVQLAAFERNYGDASNAEALAVLADEYAASAMQFHADLTGQ